MEVHQEFGMKLYWNLLWPNHKRLSMGPMFMKIFSIWQQHTVIICARIICARIIPFTTGTKERL